MKGRTYHYLAKQHDHRVSNFLGYLFFDRDLTTDNDNMDDAIADCIKTSLFENNGLAQMFKAASEFVREKPTEHFQMYVNGQTSVLDVSMLQSDGAGPRVIHAQMKNSRGTVKFTLNDRMTEPLTYPMLFTQGEVGWDKSSDVSRKEYICVRILRCEFYLPSLMNPQYFIRTNRFQAMCRLGQYYVVDLVSALLENTTRWIENNQRKIMGGGVTGGQADEEETNEEEEEIPEVDIDGNNETAQSRQTYLPASVVGSPRHMQSCALNALHIVSETGGPTEFTTLTFNVNWREFKEQALAGQTAFDRPDLVNQVIKYNSVDDILYGIRIRD
jgi:hypothetical protein